jgi:N-acetyl-beta-hexosaminidase
MLSYTDNLSNVNSRLHAQNIFLTNFPADYESDFTGQRYTWKCLNQKCVKVLLGNNERISLNSCNMLCSQPAVWPKPTSLQITNKDASVVDKTNISFEYFGQGPVKIMLQNVTDLFIKSLESLKPGNQSTSGIKLKINIILFDSNTDRLKLSTNESYSLTTKKENILTATISADNYFGARHGLETLLQLIWYDEVSDELKLLHDVSVQDSPKFPYRGVMVDTARNYFPISLLKKVLDGMAMSKLNVLHLHLTDAVSFPIVLPTIKQLADYGAYGPDMTYTPEDIKDLVQYARIRGVRLVLEIDAPSHVNAGWNSMRNDWDQKYVICGEDDVFNGHLNPDNEDVFRVLEHIYRDLIELSEQTELFHVGSDEVNLTCWKATEAVKRANSINSMKNFWGNYTNQMLDSLKRANNQKFPDHVIIWSSPLTESSQVDQLKVNVTVQHWLGNPHSILIRGHKIIYSTVGHWYLDCGFGVWKPSMQRGVCDPYTPWQTFYKYRPWVTNSYRELALGGEVCLWSEQVEVDTLETRVWPRAAAFAERVWSDPESFVDYDVYTRLGSFRDRLKSRGIQAAAMWPRWCSQNPGKC